MYEGMESARTQLQTLVTQLSGIKGISYTNPNLAQALRYARGELKSSLYSEHTILQHIATLQRLSNP